MDIFKQKRRSSCGAEDLCVRRPSSFEEGARAQDNELRYSLKSRVPALLGNNGLLKVHNFRFITARAFSLINCMLNIGHD